MELTMQPVDPSVLTSQDIDLAAYVSKTKNNLRVIRAAMVAANSSLDSLELEVQKIKDGVSDLYVMFGNEAVQMYPELQGQDIRPILSSVSGGHPLAALWYQYDVKITAMIQSMQTLIDQAEQQTQIVMNGQSTINSFLADYHGIWYRNQGLMPSVDELQRSLDQMESIPIVDAGDVKIELSTIERISPDAAAMLTMQVAENSFEEDASDIDHEDAYETPDYAQEPTLQDSGVNTGVVPAGVLQTSGINFKSPGFILSALAIAYVIMGGRE